MRKKYILILTMIMVLLGGVYLYRVNNKDIVEIKEYSTEVYGKISNEKNNLRIFYRNKKSGILNEKNGEISVEGKYDGLYFLEDNILVLKNNRLGLINFEGVEILSPDYDDIKVINRQNILLLENGKYSIYDVEKKRKIDLDVEEVVSNSDEMLLVKKGGYFGILNTDGNTVIPIEYSYLELFSEGLAVAVDKNNKIGYIDGENKFITRESYDVPIKFQDNYGIVYKNNKFGLVNKQGIEVIPVEYDNLFYVGKDRYGARIGKDIYLVDSAGEKVSPKGYELIGEEKEEKIVVKTLGKYGVIGKEGNEIIPATYSEMGNFENGLAVVMDLKNSLYGVINENNKYVIAPKNLYIKSRNGNYFIAGDENGKEILLNKDDKNILNDNFDKLDFFNKNLAVGKNEGSDEVSIIFMKGDNYKILKVNFQDIVNISSDEVIIREKNKYRVYSLN